MNYRKIRRRRNYRRRNRAAARHQDSARSTAFREAESGLNRVVLIVLIAVLAAFMTTKYIIYPAIDCDFPTFRELWEEYRPSVVLQKDEKEKTPAASETVAQKATKKTSQSASDKNKKSLKQSEEKDAETVTNYALQFGSFADRTSATALASELKDCGIDARVKKEGGLYKVTGMVFNSKKAAVSALGELDGAPEGSFVTKVKRKN